MEELLDLSGIGRDRMQLRWVSAAEGQLFAEYMTRLTEQIRELGPFDPEAFRLALASLEDTLKSPRVRWLLGMDRRITEGENVYHEKLEEAAYQELLKAAAEDEYQKALILEVLRRGPLSVREMAERTGLPVYGVSLRLNDLERSGLAELQGYEGTTPRFVRLAA